MRVFVTGMGGELGGRVVGLLEAAPEVDEVAGVDREPPRRRLHRAEFRLVEPLDRRRMVAAVREFDPTAVVHMGVYEPNARSTPKAAVARTEAASIAALGAAAECRDLRHVVVRSGIEVYGRRRGAATRPDESVAPDPTSPFGRSLLRAEGVAVAAAHAAGCPVALLRMAPVVGPHVPSPLGRYLRLPVVPVSAVADPPFSLLHQEDAAAAVLAALRRQVDGPVNVVGPGAVTASQAVRMGGRVPLPVAGPFWRAARALAELTGAPVPDHVHELLVRGRTADGGRAATALGTVARHSTPEVVKDLYEWATVTYLRAAEEAA